MSCLEEMNLSQEQAAAVLDGRSRVLVAAGAGSGKTRLLVAYFVRALIDEGVPPEQLVAVTFTRKAAAELTTRIRSSLEKCGRPDLARSLDAATIGTIHSLCRRLIKDRVLEAGVDPACGILEAEAAVLVKEEAGRQAWEKVIEESDEAALEVIASRGDALRKEMIKLYDRLRGMGRDCPQVDIPSGQAEDDARLELARLIRQAIAAAGGVGRSTASLQADLEKLRRCLDRLEQPVLLDQPELDLDAEGQCFPSRRTPAMEPFFAPVREALTRYRSVLAEKRLQPLVRAMNVLLLEFHGRYEDRKRELGLLDFADLELRARALVAGAGAGTAPAPVLPGSRVLIDEFQDTNELQCSILEGLGASRLLMVGDERQSIYRFRGADVDVFRSREVALESNGTAGPAGGVHRLGVNYRSRPEILAFLNRLFAQEGFFGARFIPLRDPGLDGRTGLDDEGAEPGREVRPAMVQPPVVTSKASAVEVLMVDRRAVETEGPALLMQEAEAEVVADRIRRLIEEEGRCRREIAVLLPAQTYVNSYRQALLARGVEVYVVRGRGYYSQEEVTDVTSLLRLLVNPHDDLALLSALRSPLAGLSDDGLYLLGREGRRSRQSLWETVRAARTAALGVDDRQLLDAFVEQVGRLRSRVGRPGLARLIDEAISACDYDVCVLASPEGKRRFANVRKLMLMANDYEALQGPDLAGFVDLLRSMGGLEDTEGSAPTLAEGEDVVRVMTVHQAKGLEFPVVVLAGLGADVPHGTFSEFVVGDDGRMGVFLKGSRHNTYESSDLCWGPGVEIVANHRLKEEEEDVRILYVAMTRAKEQLILVGATPNDGRLEKCRIGRIAAGLGPDSLPHEGGTVPLEGLDAVIARVTPSPAKAVTDRYPVLETAAAERLPVTPPRFLDSAPRSIVPRHVSFSALAAYQRCPRQYYLERVLGLELWPGKSVEEDDGLPSLEETVLDDDERDVGREIGLLVHALLERLMAADRPPTEDAMRLAAEEWLRDTGVELSADHQHRALALTLAFWDSPLVDLRASSSAVREAPFLFGQGETLVSGVMDLIRPEGELWRIVDYKTNALKGRSRAEVASNYEMQAAVYCLAALRAGAPAVQMDFVFLEQPETPVSVRCSLEDLSALESELDRALEGLRRGEFPVRPGEACESCAVVSICANVARP